MGAEGRGVKELRGRGLRFEGVKYLLGDSPRIGLCRLLGVGVLCGSEGGSKSDGKNDEFDHPQDSEWHGRATDSSLGTR